MSYFTCEVHKSQFSSIQALKEHVAKFHSNENGSTILSKPKKKKIAQHLPSTCKRSPKTSTATACDRIEKPKALTTLSLKKEENVSISITEEDTEKNFQCHICGEFYSSSTELIKHLGTHFNDNLLPTSDKSILIKTEPESNVPNIVNRKITPENYECNNSDESSESSESLASFNNDDTNDPDFYPTDTEMVDTEIANENHNEDKNTRRNKKSSTKVERSKRLSQQGFRDKRTHFCPHPNCTKAYKKSWNLHLHIRLHTGENKPYHCSWKGCDYKFARCNDLILHKRQHTGEKPNNNANCSNCKCCTRNDKFLMGYKPHLPEGKLVCYFCGYNPRILTQDFDAHMTKHTLERPYCCKICNRLCHNDERLKEHAKVHTNDDISKRNFKCVDCGSRFREGTALRKHRLTHSTYRPYTCNACPSSHKRFTDLKRHIQTVHTAGKAYKCEICPENRDFARRDFFKLHMNTFHSGVKYKEPVPQFKGSKIKSDMYQITCNLCSIRFKDNIRFLQHRKTCSGTIKPKGHVVEIKDQDEIETSSSESDNSDEGRTIPPITRRMDTAAGVDGDKSNYPSLSDKDEPIMKFRCQVCDGRLFNSEDCLKLHIKVFHANVEET